MAWRAKLLKHSHTILRVAGYVLASLFLLLCLAAYGVPGTWVQPLLDSAVPAETGRLTVERVSYRLSEGFVLERPLLCEPDGHVLASAERCAVDLRFFSFAEFADRIEGLSLDTLYLDPEFGTVTLEHLSADSGDGLTAKALTVCAEDGYVLARFDQAFAKLRDGSLVNLPSLLESLSVDALYVAQIRYDPNRVIERELPPPELRPPFPDLSQIPLPDLKNLPIRLVDPDILEMRARVIEGLLTSGEGVVRLNGIRADVDGSGRQLAEADVLLDLPNALAKASIRGFIYHDNLNGLWRAIDLPIIEDYTSNATLNGPAWGDCAFTIGFNVYDDIFDLRANLIAPQGGTYLGVPFDEASGAISCHSIWYTKAEISPLILRRDGRAVATCDFRIDAPANKLSFSVQSNGLSPEEFITFLELPESATIPSLEAEVPPSVDLSGHFPYYDETTPGAIFLQGHIAAPQGVRIDKLNVASASTNLSMRNGVLSFNELDVTLPRGGTANGALSFTIPDDDTPSTLSAAIHLEDASLADLLGPYGQDALSKCVVTGFVDLRGRLDDTFPKSLQAEYNLTVDGGLIQRLPLFAGLTDLLADHVPGIASVTDSSSARLVGTTDGGIFNIPDFSLDGDLLSIEGPATYDLPNDNLDAEVTAGNFKEDSFMGRLTRWATVPVNRFLWRVHVSGPIAAPEWVIVTFIGRFFDRAPDEKD